MDPVDFILIQFTSFNFKADISESSRNLLRPVNYLTNYSFILITLRKFFFSQSLWSQSNQARARNFPMRPKEFSFFHAALAFVLFNY